MERDYVYIILRYMGNLDPNCFALDLEVRWVWFRPSGTVFRTLPQIRRRIVLVFAIANVNIFGSVLEYMLRSGIPAWLRPMNPNLGIVRNRGLKRISKAHVVLQGWSRTVFVR